MDKSNPRRKKDKKDSAQSEKLVSLLIQIRDELVKIREKLQKQIVE